MPRHSISDGPAVLPRIDINTGGATDGSRSAAENAGTVPLAAMAAAARDRRPGQTRHEDVSRDVIRERPGNGTARKGAGPAGDAELRPFQKGRGQEDKGGGGATGNENVPPLLRRGGSVGSSCSCPTPRRRPAVSLSPRWGTKL